MLSIRHGSTRPRQSSFASVHSLPYELLAITFRFCFLNHRFMKRLTCAPPCPDEAPLLLMRVCRKWRECAISTPSLWSRISLGRKSRTKISPSLLNIKINEWLDRAGSVPLCIDVYYETYHDKSKQTAGDAALLDIFAASRRWNSVSLEVNIPSRAPCVDFILDAVLKHSPMLERFEIYFNANNPSWVVGSPMKPIEIGDNHRLTSFKIDTTHPNPFRLCLPTVKFHNIQHLHLKWPETNDNCLEILDRCPQVEVLHVAIGRQSQLSITTTILRMEKLHTFSIFSASDECVAGFLDGISTPALTAFTMHSVSLGPPRGPSKSHWPHLSQLFARSQSPLTDCELLRSPMLEDDIIKCLQHIPALTILSGDEYLLMDKVLEALTPTVNAEDMLCPALTTVMFRGIHNDLNNTTPTTYRQWRFAQEISNKDVVNVGSVAAEAIEGRQTILTRRVWCERMRECMKRR
ncbi:hypothetical protein BD410DRAFT_787767 [Rickenella mellea]|uniref:F-box domain-containing protein n=1 Tax=Rickenella mellea TaxID=50990 RepID=A0A4Y7Q6U9_9AGAM|nr:hypothetical protein BD410DRAFT_787767 [Rickenella mellea]